MEYLTKEWVLFIFFAIPSGLLILFVKSYVALMLGIQSQLRSSIMRYYYDFVDKQYIYTDAMECVEEMYKSYKKLGGNGFIEKKVEFLRTLPNVKIKKEEQ